MIEASLPRLPTDAEIERNFTRIVQEKPYERINPIPFIFETNPNFESASKQFKSGFSAYVLARHAAECRAVEITLRLHNNGGLPGESVAIRIEVLPVASVCERAPSLPQVPVMPQRYRVTQNPLGYLGRAPIANVANVDRLFRSVPGSRPSRTGPTISRFASHALIEYWYNVVEQRDHRDLQPFFILLPSNFQLRKIPLRYSIRASNANGVVTGTIMLHLAFTEPGEWLHSVEGDVTGLRLRYDPAENDDDE